MALILQVISGWSFLTATVISALFVLTYILLGGLRATMYNEVLQFALIVIGFTPLAWSSLRYFGSRHALRSSLPADMGHIWAGMHAVIAHGDDGLPWRDLRLSSVLSFDDWCTDFVMFGEGWPRATLPPPAARRWWRLG